MSNYRTKINPFTGQLQLVNDEGILFFKESVATVGDLPLVGNTKNDARFTNDTGYLYIWSGTAWISQGDIIDLKWAAIEDKPSSAVADIDDAVSKRHTQNTDLYLNTQVTKIFYVDKNRIDVYTENGSITKPFRTIQSAINQIITNGDNDLYHYTIKIATGDYTSQGIILLENTNLRQLNIESMASDEFAVQLSGIKSTLNNDNLSRLGIIRLSINTVEMEGASEGSYLGGSYLTFYGCAINTSCSIKNCGGGFTDSTIYCDMLIENAFSWITGYEGQRSTQNITIRWDDSKKKPSGWTYTYFVVQNGICGKITTERLGVTGSVSISIRKGARVGGTTVTNINGTNCTIDLEEGVIRGNLTNNGTLNITNGYVRGTLIGNAPTLYGKCSQIKNDSTVVGTSVKDALNTLEMENFTAYIEDDTESSTTEITYQEKLKLTFTPLTAGDYLIEWFAEVTNTVTNAGIRTRIQQDDTTDLTETNGAPFTSNIWNSISGFKKVTLDTSSHDFDMDYRVHTIGTAKIRRARLVAIKV